MIPLLQAISQVAVPVVAEPINVGGNGGGDMGFTMFSVILSVIAAAVVAFLAHSKASALAIYRERAEERRQDKEIADLKEQVANREHWLQHQVDNRQPFPGRGGP